MKKSVLQKIKKKKLRKSPLFCVANFLRNRWVESLVFCGIVGLSNDSICPTIQSNDSILSNDSHVCPMIRYESLDKIESLD